MIQAGIILFSCLSIFLLSRKDRWMPYGFIVGLMGQPLWFISSWQAGQWGVFAVSVFFTWRHITGIKNHFRRSNHATQKN